jgi:PAS domain S-box-containing protein
MTSRRLHLTDITFNLIVEATPNAVLLVNAAGKIGYANRQCEALFGYAYTELIGQEIGILVPERTQAVHSAHVRAFFRKPETRTMGTGRELFARRKDGSEFPVEVGLKALTLIDGTWVLATVVDITERRQAEDRFEQVVHSAPNAIVLVNRKQQIVLVNQQACQLFGYEATQIVGQSVERLIPERFRARHGGYFASFFGNLQARAMGSGRDLVGLRSDGREVPIEVGLNPIHTNQGTMVLASIIDITERRERDELRLKKEAAEAASRAKSELLAIASHDLKNPLAAISGLAEILLLTKRAEPDSSPRDIEFLERIRNASSRMLEVVQGILANEGLEQPGLQLRNESVDLSRLCDELVRFNEASAQRKNIRLQPDITAGIVVEADRMRLREAFDNYLSNAIKYSPPGAAVTVGLRWIPEVNQVEFGVRDEGPGLTEDDKAKLFGKFSRLSARPTGGESSTGLGLSIVKTIVELHGGSVGCDSIQGHGSYFWARLPVSGVPGNAPQRPKRRKRPDLK